MAKASRLWRNLFCFLVGVALAAVVILANAAEPYTVKRGDTLSSIVRQAYPKVPFEQALVGVYEANPGAFEGNMNVLKAGAPLYLGEIPLPPLAAARREVQNQYDAFTGGQNPRAVSARTLRDAMAYQIELLSEPSRAAPPSRSWLDDTTCLALNVYYEDRGDVLEGQLAVAWVTTNRARAAGTPVCFEVFRPYQFSWTLDADKWAALPNDLAWATALKVARLVQQPGMLDFTHGANHFHTQNSHPIWADRMPSVGVFGAHVFYRSGH
jgi:phage tail protein X